MDIGLKWIVAIIFGLLVIYGIFAWGWQKYIPAADAAASVKVNLQTNDLVQACKEWASNLVLSSTIQTSLVKAAVSADMAEEDRWEYCRICAESVSKPPLPCRQCRASCVKLLIDESTCRANPGRFPDSFDYSMSTHKAKLNNEYVEMDYNTAYSYCVWSRIGKIKAMVTDEVNGVT